MKEEVKAGIIIVASFAILSMFIILIGGSSTFEKLDKYYVRVMNAAGLETGAQVRIGGVRVGRVLKIEGPSGPGKPVTIEIGVGKEHPVYKGTRAMIAQVGMVGDIYLLLAVDRTAEGRINPGEDIPFETTGDFAQIMTKMNSLSESVDGLIKDVNKLFSEKNINEFGSLLKNTNHAVVSGSAGINRLAAVLKDTNDKLQGVLNEVEAFVKTNGGDFSQLIKKAKADLEQAGEMIKSFEATAKSVDKTSGAVTGAVNLQSRNLDNLLNTMTRTTADLQEVLQELKVKPWSVIYKEEKEN